jgi:hypothetical protein
MGRLAIESTDKRLPAATQLRVPWWRSPGLYYHLLHTTRQLGENLPAKARPHDL